jgi:hypothetical protein
MKESLKAVKMEEIHSSETLVIAYKTIRCYSVDEHDSQSRNTLTLKAKQTNNMITKLPVILNTFK